MAESVEGVAFELFRAIAEAEKKTGGYNHPFNSNADREWILSVYAECLKAVKGEPGNAPVVAHPGA